MSIYDSKLISNICDDLSKTLKKNRYLHSLGVSYTAAVLAMKYGADYNKAQIAGLLHDCAKNYDDSELIKLCKKNNIEISDTELNYGYLLHGKYGAYLARKKYKIEDDEILNAIIWHTTGHENMTLMEKIVFIADYIEPSRNKALNLNEIRNLAFNSNSINDALIKIMHDTLEYIGVDSDSLDTNTLNAYNYYCK